MSHWCQTHGRICAPGKMASNLFEESVIMCVHVQWAIMCSGYSGPESSTQMQTLTNKGDVPRRPKEELGHTCMDGLCPMKTPALLSVLLLYNSMMKLQYWALKAITWVLFVVSVHPWLQKQAILLFIISCLFSSWFWQVKNILILSKLKLWGLLHKQDYEKVLPQLMLRPWVQ